MSKFRRSLPWALAALAVFYSGMYAAALAAGTDPAAAPTAAAAPVNGAGMGDLNLDVGKIIEDIKSGNAPGIIGFLIVILTWLISGKTPKAVTGWLEKPQNEWAKPAITVLLGILGVALPQVFAGVGVGKALLFGFMASGGGALAFKLAKTFFNSWAAKKGFVVVDVPAKEAESIVKIPDQASREKAWAELVTKLSGGTAAPAPKQ